MLELSKVLMYNIHYNSNKIKYSDQIELLFTDTESLMCEIENANVYEDLKKDNIYLTAANF